jgi:hypothetical protein
LNRKSKLVAVGVVAALMLASGFLTYRVFAPQATNTRSDGFGLSGYATIKVYHADGTLASSWQGHNSLYQNGISAVAQCLSGQTSAGILLGNSSCTNITPTLEVDDTTYAAYRNAATNTLAPSGCNPNGNPGTCTGWAATTTIDFSSLSSSVTIMRASADGSSLAAFDNVNISPNIVVNPGDRMIVTITFTIS